MTTSLAAFLAPGIHRFGAASQMLEYGQKIRDVYLMQYPLLPEAAKIWQQLASTREWKVSGKKRAVPRTVDYLNNAVCPNTDGTIDYGLEPFLKRRAMDYLCVGRTAYYWEPGTTLRYLDPIYLTYILDERVWFYGPTQEKFPVSQIVVNHPFPIGGDGNFVAPLLSVIPTAMLAWLIREHVSASADGRKIRDIMLVVGDDLADEMQRVIGESVAAWNGANPASNNVPVISTEFLPGMKAEDYIARIGLANIPPGFDLEAFQFEYVNEIAGATGLPMRMIWNSEKATNRALEEVQQEREAWKGPAVFVRTEHRNYNGCGMIRHFGPTTRFAFVEEVDVSSQLKKSEILKNYAEALEKFATVFGGTVNGDAFLAWLQSEGLLPADLQLITNIGELQTSDQMPTPQTEEDKLQESDPMPSAALEKSAIDYDEISMDADGRILETRSKVISFEQVLAKNPPKYEYVPVKFKEALQASRTRNLAELKKLAKTAAKYWDEEDAATVKALTAQSAHDDNDYRAIRALLHKRKIQERKAS